MGYYTSYSLTVDNLNDEELDSLDKVIKENIGMDGGAEWCSWSCYAKWYDHEDDMRKLSQMFPNAIFYLFGSGEEYDDIWFKYFKNGKMQYDPAEITFDDFDETKLE